LQGINSSPRNSLIKSQLWLDQFASDLIADNFLEDFAQCVASIRAHTDTPISIFASGKENQAAESMYSQ